MTTTKRAARPSRLRILALIERARYRHGWTVQGGRSAQDCPCCHTTVWAPLPDEGISEPTPEAIDAYGRKVINRLTDAVVEHLHHDCPDTREESR
jgi:hypothetical protein